MEIRRYVTRAGREIFGEWRARLPDTQARARVLGRIDRLAVGNFGDSKRLRNGVSEMRIDWGPGYRVYYGIVGNECVLLLCGGDKRTQAPDIERATGYLRDYRERTGQR